MSTIDITPARERAGLTKSELARRLGVPASTIRRIENRPGYDPRFSTAHEIAVALGCRLDELVRDPPHRRGPGDARTRGVTPPRTGHDDHQVTT